MAAPPDARTARNPSDLERQVRYLSTLMQLAQQFRRAETPGELAFMTVNDLLPLFPYRQAVFWQAGSGGRVRITAISGVDQVDGDAPYSVFLKKLIRTIEPDPDKPVRTLSRDNLPEPLQVQWAEWSPGHILAADLHSRDGRRIGGLVFMRPAAWQQAETALAERVADTFAHAWLALQARRRGWPSLLTWRGRRLPRLAAALLMIGLLFVPIHLSVLAPLEIIALDPVVVAAPMDGVVKAFQVAPNQPVKADQPLFTLDDIRIRNEHDIALKALSVARADELRARQKAFADEASRAELLLIGARIEQQQATIDYLAEQLARSRVTAAVDGVAVFRDVSDWLGKPVVVGEKIMTLANPQQVAAQIQLPVADAINLHPGARVRLFLNIAPERPISATLHQAAYEAQVTPDGVLAFRLESRLADGETPPRIGLRGTAKIYGEKVSLFYFLMRRPLAAVRQLLGI